MKLALALVFGILTAGCTSTKLLPSNSSKSTSYFDSYEHAISFIELVEPNKTTADDLTKMGIEIHGNNVKVLNYVEVMEIFLSNPAIEKSDLPTGILECLGAKEGCQAYQLTIDSVEEERYGNFLIDFLNFRKKTKHTGWSFKALFVIIDDTVVYVLHSGEPKINKREIRKNPLGPIQSFDAGNIYEILSN